MDNLTHTLAGALVGAALAPRHADARSLSLPQRMFIGALAANVPDLDILAAPFLDPLAYLGVHRGLSHSLLVLPLLALAGAWLTQRLTRGRHRFGESALIIAVALGSHVLLDLVTSYGTRILAPLDDTPYSFALMFIIDLPFTLILIVGLVLAWRRRAAGVAVLTLGVALGWLGVQAAFQARAVSLATEAAAAWGPDARISVLPQPLSPAHWKLVLVRGEEYRIAHANLLGGAQRSAPADAGLVGRVWNSYQPEQHLVWETFHRFGADRGWHRFARTAWSQPDFAGFRAFALLPHLDQVEDRKLAGCAWFTDLRFRVPGMTRDPFRYGVCHAFDGGWTVESASQQRRRRPAD